MSLALAWTTWRWWNANRVTTAATLFAALAALAAAIVAWRIGREAATIATEQTNIAKEQKNIANEQTTIANEQRKIAAAQARTADTQRDIAGLDVLIKCFKNFTDGSVMRKARLDFAVSYGRGAIAPRAAVDILNCFEEVALYVDQEVVKPEIVWHLLPDIVYYWTAAHPFVLQQQDLTGDRYEWCLTHDLVEKLREVSARKQDELLANLSKERLAMYFKGEAKGCAPPPTRAGTTRTSTTSKVSTARARLR